MKARSIVGAVRRNFNAPTLVATLALVFALTGGALAAKRYLITSKKQISPSVLAALKGAAGKSGAPGATGAPGGAGPAGPAGAVGKEGPQGPKGEPGAPGAPGKDGKSGENGVTGFTATLPSKQTETGTWSAILNHIVGEGETATPISFSIPVNLKSEERGAAVYVTAEEAELGTNATCKGSIENPTAPVGTLCIYAQLEANEGVSTPPVVIFDGELGFGRPGALMLIHSNGGTEEAPGRIRAVGSWAVTAP